jgi:flagellar protein FlgJ
MVASRPAAAVNGGAMGGSFASTFQAVQHAVADFLAHGSSAGPANGSGMPAQGASNLSLEGLALLQKSGQGAVDNAGVDPATRQAFLNSIQPWAEDTARRLGVAPEVVAAHAALESGWGQHALRNNGAGADSNNLFGLKAGSGWQGAVASAVTTEFQHGVALKKTEQFRSYPDTASAFRDYADLLTGSPRYQAALNTGSDARAFAHGLAQGGYATDPAYADKLSQLATQLMRQGGAGNSARLLLQSGN